MKFFRLLMVGMIAVGLLVSVVPAQADGLKTISAKALLDHECDSSEWHFVITQVSNESLAPVSITVTWENSNSETVDLKKFTGGVAHYTTTSNLDSTVVSATAEIYNTWSGQFNLSHGPCGSTATSTPGTTSTPGLTETPGTPPTSTSTAIETSTPGTGTQPVVTNTPTNTATATNTSNEVIPPPTAETPPPTDTPPSLSTLGPKPTAGADGVVPFSDGPTAPLHPLTKGGLTLATVCAMGLMVSFIPFRRFFA